MTLVFAAAMSSTQIILVERWNRMVGVNDFVFAMGDEVVNDWASFTIQMPTLVMMAALSPSGAEATVYALMTVVNNLGMLCGGVLSSLLAQAYGVSLTDFSNLKYLILATSASTLLPIAFIPFTPKSAKHCEDTSIQKRSRIGGACFLGVLCLGLVFSLGHTTWAFVWGDNGSVGTPEFECVQ